MDKKAPFAVLLGDEEPNKAGFRPTSRGFRASLRCQDDGEVVIEEKIGLGLAARAEVTAFGLKRPPGPDECAPIGGGRVAGLGLSFNVYNNYFYAWLAPVAAEKTLPSTLSRLGPARPAFLS